MPSQTCIYPHKKLLLLLPLLAAATSGLAQRIAPVSLQPDAVITLPAGTAPSALAIADYNQDGRPTSPLSTEA